jgi:maltose alpha-D-glucosyltransferase/alpha-amylase
MLKQRSSLLFVLILLAGCKPEPKPEANIDAWYKHLLIYNLDIKTFKDSDGDGEGDIRGLTGKLDYLASLGINTIWLAPFQPSPLQDDGYDITDYEGIDPKLGNRADLAEFLKQAKARHLKVIMDIVLNHSSIAHPWFKTRPDWYVWAKDKPKDWDKGMGFPGVEKETWRFDSAAHAYYFHRFYHFQPDLNFQNPQVVQQAEHVMAYWLDLGLDGFRLDAVPFIIDDPRKDAAKPRFDFSLLHELTGFVRKHKPQAVLLGEANVEPEENSKYFSGHHDGLQMMFNFYANQYLFYGLATGDIALFKDAVEKTKIKPGVAQWAWFLRNHDEIDLGRLSKHQRNQVYEKMGPDTNMQLYQRGIRRRLATMLGDDPRQLRLAYSLLYSLPGTPVIRQGEELGMGDDLSLKERLSVRTPMQWDTSRNAGFSSAAATFRPIINAGVYGYRRLNVKAARDDPRSLLNFVAGMIRLRKSCPEIDNGDWQLLPAGSVKVLAICYNAHGRKILVCHNFAAQSQKVSIELNGVHRLASMTGGDPPAVHNQRLDFSLGRYGFQWYRLD